MIAAGRGGALDSEKRYAGVIYSSMKANRWQTNSTNRAPETNSPACSGRDFEFPIFYFLSMKISNAFLIAEAGPMKMTRSSTSIRVTPRGTTN